MPRSWHRRAHQPRCRRIARRSWPTRGVEADNALADLALSPLLLLAPGAGASFVPWFPEITLSSEVVLIGLLPPLLYATAISTSLV